MEIRTSLVFKNTYFVKLLGIAPLVGLTLRVDYAIIMAIAVLFITLYQGAVYAFIEPSMKENQKDWAFLGTLLVGGTLFLSGLWFFSPTYYKAIGFYIKILFLGTYIFELQKGRSEEENLSTWLGHILLEGLGYILLGLFLSLIREALGAGTISLPHFVSGGVSYDIPVLSQAPISILSQPTGFFLLFLGAILLYRLFGHQKPVQTTIHINDLHDHGGGLKTSKEDKPAVKAPDQIQRFLYEIKDKTDDLILTKYMYIGKQSSRGIQLFIMMSTLVDGVRGDFYVQGEEELEKIHSGIYQENMFPYLSQDEKSRFFLKSKDPSKHFVKMNSLLQRLQNYHKLEDLPEQVPFVGVIYLDLSLNKIEDIKDMSDFWRSINDKTYVIFSGKGDLYRYGLREIQPGIWQKNK
ncbi:Rnf-Nqr domain containing protein [Spirochaeta cellobiosiphila]|uniref:Rnf-Nqr domain containing protein n=1 Tax=Spirochaeta cellobiosiphila TaxID=504483 RepID=UPI0003FAA272|nr:Rnf-Nqr domain containing protein [Spirochaeta cellobiosiphila]